MYLLAICMSSLGKYLFRSSVHLLIRLLRLFAIEFYEFLYILDINPLSAMICKYFFPFDRLPFPFVDGFLCCAEECFPILKFFPIFTPMDLNQVLIKSQT